MIVFDLKCGTGHVFEAWFGSSDAYEAQRAGGMIQCPMCGDGDVAKAVMAPNVGAKGNQSPAIAPAALKAAMAAVAEIQSKMLEKSQWVGTAFADTARAMHLGDAPQAQIHGQATADEARELVEEGVPVAPLLVPIVPPEACN
ncbi:DUF1178 family protein [Sphingomonas sp. JC676]|uniref:DUF1178 family protein n=1 Tax=Sphingomonas sp. JC676 TaxID=2768065 RepID=UPI00165811F1|nr:DUF1178 family protein [Sphingomonas sp. JC676]MBC9031070.1 DUF1178 family protein [Sphingomonas sp. JC676]